MSEASSGSPLLGRDPALLVSDRSSTSLTQASDGEDDLDFTLLPSSLNELLTPMEQEQLFRAEKLSLEGGFEGVVHSPRRSRASFAYPDSPPDSFVLGLLPRQGLHADDHMPTLDSSFKSRQTGGSPWSRQAHTTTTAPPPLQFPSSSGGATSFDLEEDFPSLGQTQKGGRVTVGLSFANVAKAGVIVEDTEDPDEGNSGGVDLSTEPVSWLRCFSFLA